MSEIVTTAPSVETGVEAPVSDGEVFAPVSSEFDDVGAAEVEEPKDKSPLAARIALRVATLAQSASEKAEEVSYKLAERRTTGEVFDDIKDSAAELRKGVSTLAGQEAERASEFVNNKIEKGKATLKLFGKSAIKGTLKVVTSPMRGASELGGALADGMKNGLNKVEKRAQEAQGRKEERQSDRAEYKAQRADAKQIHKGEKRANKMNAELRRISTKFERAERANQRKASRKAFYQSARNKGQETAQKAAEVSRSAARKTGRGVVLAAGVSLFAADIARTKASQAKDTYHMSRAISLDNKAEKHRKKL